MIDSFGEPGHTLTIGSTRLNWAAGPIEPVSVTNTTMLPAGGGRLPDISADGRFVAFESRFPLVAGDTNNQVDVFVRDRLTGVVTRESVTSSGGQVEPVFAESGNPALSADGRYVAFVSTGGNLVAGDTNGHADVFVRDRQTGTTSRVSVDSAGAEANRASTDRPAISADGRFVAFESSADNLAGTDENFVADVFVRDRQAGTTTRASINTDGAESDQPADSPAISADGRYVAFASRASNLTSPAGSHDSKILLRDRVTNTTTLVSQDDPAVGAEGILPQATDPDISADGRMVVFTSTAVGLVPGDGNGAMADVFAYDRSTGTTTRVSRSTGGAQADQGSAAPAISPDGRLVAFTSVATNLVAGDTNAARDVFVHDRRSGATSRVSTNSAGVQGNGSSGGFSGEAPVISADGRYVAFVSGASNLVPWDAHGEEVFVRRLDQGVRRQPVADFDGDGNSDRSVFRGGQWYVEEQSTGYFGLPDDVPVPADYDRDGDVDRAVYRSGAWFAEDQQTAFFGLGGDVPVPADYDGDGDVDRAVFRNGAWFTEGQPTVYFGLSGDVPVPADYDGDGDVDRAVFRASFGGWYVQDQPTAYLGLSGDVPVPADYDGDGDVDRAVFRPNVGGWYVDGKPTAYLGLSGDVPVPADYDGDGDVDRAVFRPSSGGWYVDGKPTVSLGLRGDIPLPLPTAVYSQLF